MLDECGLWASLMFFYHLNYIGSETLDKRCLCTRYIRGKKFHKKCRNFLCGSWKLVNQCEIMQAASFMLVSVESIR